MTVVAYALTVCVMAALDFLWLGVVAKSFYAERLAHLLAPTVTWWAAGAFYLLFVFALYYFAINPAYTAGSLSLALMNGAFLGFIAYATYDLTNTATLPLWPISVTLVDVAWGTCTSAATAVVGYKLLVAFSA
jgi:uncharacterized membrane protein